jgi:hypothetical protein
LALNGVVMGWSASSLSILFPVLTAPDMHWVESWMSPSARLDIVGNKKSLSNLSSSVAPPVA